MTDFVPDKKDLVCSDHFEINCFRSRGKHSSLYFKRKAVPTIICIYFTEVVSEVENNKGYNVSHEITMADDYHQEVNNSTPMKRAFSGDSSCPKMRRSESPSPSSTVPLKEINEGLIPGKILLYFL